MYRGDGSAVVALVGDRLLRGDALQLIGDGLVVALALQTQGAADLAGACARALRQRGWDGDDELADQLGALLGTGPTPLLRPLPVDLEELAGVLEGDPTFGGGRVDLLTGQVWPRAAIDYARETGEEDEDESDDPDRWRGCIVRVPAPGITTWCSSSAPSTTLTAPTGWASRSKVLGRSAGSSTCWPVGPANSTGGTGTPTTGSADGPGRGSRTRVTAPHGLPIHRLDDSRKPGRATPKRGLRVTRIPANPPARTARCSPGDRC